MPVIGQATHKQPELLAMTPAPANNRTLCLTQPAAPDIFIY